ncbi:MAG: type IV secretion system DNA-binding domain-containing protein [Deltaproteobacteria bacterium]|nr:type IV secretion system DNA-binding domain-containing protein [Deltaproteobacteria bacterium]
MATYCLHIPRDTVDEARAAMVTAGEMVLPAIFENTLNDLHEGLKRQFSLEIYAVDQAIYLCFSATGAIADILVGAFYSMLPAAELHQIPDYLTSVGPEAAIVSTELGFERSDIYPINTFRDFKYDTLGPMVNVLSSLPPEDLTVIQVVTQPIPDDTWLQLNLSRRRSADAIAHIFRVKYWFKSDMTEKFDEQIQKKCSLKLYQTTIRIAVIRATPAESAEAELRDRVEAVVGGFSQLNTPDLNRLNPVKWRSGHAALAPLQKRSFGKKVLLSSPELASVWHPLDLSTLPNTARVLAKKASPPVNLPREEGSFDISFFAHTDYRDHHLPFGLNREDRRRHVYIIGKSGCGKSCLMQLLIKSDIEAGYGVAVLDPHGDLVNDVLRLVPGERVNDVVMLDPSDREFPASFNPLAWVPEDLRMNVALDMVATFQKLFDQSWNEHLDLLLRYTTVALLSTHDATLLSIPKILTDERYRTIVASNVSDDGVRHFWLHEYGPWSEQHYSYATAPLINMIGQFTAPDLIRNIVGHPLNRFDFRDIIDNRKILLVKVPKGLLGEENATLFGSLVLTRIYQAAISRADTEPGKRQDFYLYVDEFHNFAAKNLKDILTESRKYHLNLTVAHQFLGQLPEVMRQTVFGNVGNIISFGVSGEDAAILANEFKPRFDALDLMNLRLRDFYVKMAIKGETQEAFSGRTLDLVYPKWHHSEKCIEASRREYALPLSQAQQLLQRWEHGEGLELRPEMLGQPQIDLRQHLRRYGTILQLSYLDLNDEHLIQLNHAAFHNVQVLQLTDVQIGDLGAAHIANLSNLVRLRLDGTLITDEALKYFASLPKLRHLRLDRTTVSDVGMLALRGCQIKELILHSTQISDRCLDYLREFPALKELALQDTAVTDRAIERLRLARPELNVHR